MLTLECLPQRSLLDSAANIGIIGKREKVIS